MLKKFQVIIFRAFFSNNWVLFNFDDYFNWLYAGLNTIFANDLDAGAVEVIKKNIAHNDVNELVQASHDDAINLLYRHRKVDDQFDVVDLDPYGTPAQFLGEYHCEFALFTIHR